MPIARPALIFVTFALVVGCSSTTSPAPARTIGQPSDPPTTPGPAPSGSPEPSAAIAFPLEATMAELAVAMADGRLTSLQLVDFYLERIARYDDDGPRLNSIVALNPHAREDAAALDSERASGGPRSLLHGIPLVIKDNIDTMDMPTTGGSRALDGLQPERDAFQVDLLRKAGAVILAKTNMKEFAWGWDTTSSLFGQTRNPYDVSLDPGGSSGGTAVAVTANFAAGGLGTDTCGSVRLPAAHTNLYGLRPTLGLSSRSGVIPLAPTIDTVGPMARTIGDLAILVDATSVADPDDPITVGSTVSLVDVLDHAGLAGRRIGLAAMTYSISTGTADGVNAVVDELRSAGAEVVDVSLPGAPDAFPLFYQDFAPALDAYLAAHTTAPVRTLDALIAANVHLPDIDDFLRDAAAAEGHDATYAQAHESRKAFRDDVVALMDEHDLDGILYPTSPWPAAVIGGNQQHAFCTAGSGLPAIAIPGPIGKDGLPFGFELMGRPFAEDVLFAMAAGYEAATDWRLAPASTMP